MAQATNTHDRYDLAANGDNVREQLADVIYNIDPTETPFVSMAGRGNSTSDKKEWLLDNLAAVNNANAHIDGDEFAGEALTAPVRLQNYHQIAKKQLVISRRANKLTKAGRKQEMAYQKAKRGSELKRDIEAICMQTQQAVVVGDSTTAPKVGAVGAWIRTNTNRGTSGTDPTLSGTNDGYPNAAPGNGTDRALSEATIHAQMAAAYTAGGNPSRLMMGPIVKGRFSNYMFSSSARIATPYQDHGANKRSGVTAIAAVDVFASDYGVLDATPNRFQNETEVWGLDMKMWEISYIDSFLYEEMGQTGDARKAHILSDFTICSHQEAASFVIADIDSALAMTA